MKRVITVIVILGAMLSAHIMSAEAATTPAACSAGYVNLSFDDGPTQYTPALLATLKSNSLKGTFFNVNDRMASYPSYTKSEYTAGHQIGNHTPAHEDLTQAVSPTNDLVRTQYLLIQQTGAIPTFYRPPYGATNPTVRAKAVELGLTEVIWTVDTVDWSSPSTASIVAAASTVQPGGFILMHDGYANTISAIPGIASMLKSRGLCAGKIVTSATPTVAWENMSFNATVAKF